MSDLIVIGYPDENRAQQVWEELDPSAPTWEQSPAPAGSQATGSQA
jgi:hypothetical protein